MEAPSKEGGVSKSHLFLVCAKTEEGGGSSRDHGSSWNWKLQPMKLAIAVLLSLDIVVLYIYVDIYNYINGGVFILSFVDE